MVGDIEWASQETIRKLNETLEFDVEYMEDDFYRVHFKDTVRPSSFIVEIRERHMIACSAVYEMDTERLILFMEIFVKLLNS
jgi:hypothetical protein